jgi:hypothetical protein
MATNATNSTPGRMARVSQWLLPSRREGAFTLAVDVAAWFLGVPLPVHIVLALAMHTLWAFLA